MKVNAYARGGIYNPYSETLETIENEIRTCFGLRMVLRYRDGRDIRGDAEFSLPANLECILLAILDQPGTLTDIARALLLVRPGYEIEWFDLYGTHRWGNESLEKFLSRPSFTYQLLAA